MSLTHDELCDRILLHYDAEQVLEVLHISVEDLLNRFDDRVTEHFEKLEEELDEL